MSDAKPIYFKYFFRFDDLKEKILDIRLDPATLNLLPKKRDRIPDWAALDYSKCGFCPYDGALHKYCPIALNLTDVLETFSARESYETVDVLVATEEREYFKRTTAQAGLSSAIGVYMVTSGCPVMDILKPMVRHHLPFASIEETMFRTVSTYLAVQYVLKQQGGTPDWDMVDLVAAYKKIEQLNKAIIARFRKASQKDANYNALIILDIFAKFLPLTIERALSKNWLPLSGNK